MKITDPMPPDWWWEQEWCAGEEMTYAAPFPVRVGDWRQAKLELRGLDSAADVTILAEFDSLAANATAAVALNGNGTLRLMVLDGSPDPTAGNYWDTPAMTHDETFPTVEAVIRVLAALTPERPEAQEAP